MVIGDIIAFYFVGMFVYAFVVAIVGTVMDGSPRWAARAALTLPVWPLVAIFLGPYFLVKLIAFVWRTAEFPTYVKTDKRKGNDY